jgi:hypothetical protein
MIIGNRTLPFASALQFRSVRMRIVSEVTTAANIRKGPESVMGQQCMNV